MAQNVDDNDLVIKISEALTVAEEKNEEIERLRRGNEELRGNQQGSSHSAAFQETSKAERSLSEEGRINETPPSLKQQNTDSNLSICSFENQVKESIATIAQAVGELQNTVRDLAERVNEIQNEMNERMDKMNDNIQDRMDIHALENMDRFDERFQTKFEELEDRVHSENRKIQRGNEEIEKRINKYVEEKIRSIRHTVVILSKPQILLLGGADGNKKVRSDIFQLDYATKKWKILPIKMPYGVAQHGCVIVNDELYIIGGEADGIARSSVQRLNKQLKWEERTDMHEARFGIENSCVVYDNCIWVFGGRRDENGTFIYSNTVEKYDPNMNRWEKKPEMKSKRRAAAAAVIKNKIYVCGGINKQYLDVIEVFDTTSEVWTDFCTMPEPRCGLCVVVEGTSIILIGGSFNGIHETVWKMNVEEKKKKWTYLPPLNQARSYSASVTIGGGYILVIGGYGRTNSNMEVLNTAEIFDGQTWNEFSSLPEERGDHTMCFLTISMVDAFKKFLH